MASNGEGSAMDPELWGTLQNHLDLKNIYAKLPLCEFFQLRLVCKEWNRLASDREFLEASFTAPVAKPYFIVFGQHGTTELNRLLSYDASTEQWSSTPIPGRYLEREGLLYSYAFDDGCYAAIQRVFNLHTRVCHDLPRVPDASAQPFVALRVDTSAFPYTFQVLYASDGPPTQLYDSTHPAASWTIHSHNHPVMAPGPTASCAEANGILYIRSELDGLVSYDLAKGAWSMYMDAPPGDCDDYLRSIAAWQGRLVDVTVALKERSITAWELADQLGQKWEALMRMPEELFAWIAYDDNPDPPVDVDSDVEIRTSFCSEFVLVYAWLREEGLAERFVMGNLATKAWQKVEPPFGECCISEECEL